MDPFRQVNAGEPLQISAGTWNRLMEVGRAFGRRRGEVNDQPLESDPLGPTVRIWVKNDTGADLDEHAILGLTTPPIDPTASPYDAQRGPIFSGIAPTAGGVFAVCEEPLADGAIGRAIVMGVAVVTLNVVDAGHKYASCTTATDKLTSGATGTVRVLWAESGTGDKLGLVLLQSLVGAGTWSTTEAGSLTAEAQTGGGTKTCDTGTDDSRGGWWVTARQSDGPPDDPTNGYVPYYVAYTGTSPVPDGGYVVAIVPFEPGDRNSPASGAHVSVSIFAQSGSPVTVTALEFVPVSGSSLAPATSLLLAGGHYGTGDHGFGVVRSSIIRPGIDRDFATGDRPIVRGGIVIGYIDSGGTSYYG